MTHGRATAPVATIVGVALTTVRVSAKTQWIFLELADDQGRLGHGEATLQRREAAVAERVVSVATAYLGQPVDPQQRKAWLLLPRTMDGGAAASAFDHAMWDLAAQAAELPLARLLGSCDVAVPLYANVNRGLPSREPQAFALAVRAAVDAGFDAVKIAPFDEIDVHGRWGAPLPVTKQGMALGLARIEAAREALGPAIDLMVDCHWRFDQKSAHSMVDAVAAYRLGWLECPVPEDAAWLPLIADLRKRANHHGMRLAGGEDGVGCAAFEPFLAANTYDVLMPDIKYVGGIAEMQEVARRAQAKGVAIAPHNPSGPIAHAVSAHVCTVLPGFDRLELQFEESTLFDTLLDPPLPQPSRGQQHLPAAPGLGVRLHVGMQGGEGMQRLSWGRIAGATH